MLRPTCTASVRRPESRFSSNLSVSRSAGAEPALLCGVRVSVMKRVAVCLALGLLARPALAGERAKNPAEAVVFIRLIGSVHAQIEELGQTRTVDRDRLELGTGSGFFISHDGYVLTNHHGVEPEDIVITEGLRKATVTLKPTRIEVCHSREMVEARGAISQCLEASVAATDSARDLAVLSIAGSNL